jgi:hypothetical protein
MLQGGLNNSLGCMLHCWHVLNEQGTRAKHFRGACHPNVEAVARVSAA